MPDSLRVCVIARKPHRKPVFGAWLDALPQPPHVLEAPRKRYDGEILLLAALLFLWSTFGLELLRADPHSLTRAAALAAALVVTLVGARAELKGRRSRWAPASLPR